MGITVFDQKNNLGEILNIYCQTPSGFKANIKASDKISIKELLKMIADDIGFEEQLIGNGIYFLYDGSILDYKSNMKLNSKLKGKDRINIIIIDPKNIIDTIRNITFLSSIGQKTMIKGNITTTIANLIKKYKEEIEMDEDGNDEEIIFLFKGQNLNPHSKETIEKILKDPIITVVTMND